ncbi:MAG: hypothetical protein ACKO5A_08115 [Actinomycetota bacterium]
MSDTDPVIGATPEPPADQQRIDPIEPTHSCSVEPITAAPVAARRRRNQRGEGVISTAIAVLVVAFIGIGLWRGFDAMVNSAYSRSRAKVDQIGR